MRDFVQNLGVWAMSAAVLLGGCQSGDNIKMEQENAPASVTQKHVPVQLTVLGSGAADHEWDRYGDEDVRGSASLLLNDTVLIDCGDTVAQALRRFEVDASKINDLVITHSHSDHFRPEVIGEFLQMRGDEAPPLQLWASPEAIGLLANMAYLTRMETHELRGGEVFQVGEFRFTALPANHLTDFPEEQALNYLIESPEGNILYALDGAWMLKQARVLIGKKKLDLLIWDATTAQPGDWRSFEHNDLAMIELLEKPLRNDGNIHENSKTVLSHTARTLWPSSEAESEALAQSYGWTLAKDGMVLILEKPNDAE